MLGKVGAGREVAFQQGLVEWYSLLGTSSWGGGDRWLGVAGAVFRGQVGTEGTGTGPRLEQSRRLKQLTCGWAAVLGPVVGLGVQGVRPPGLVQVTCLAKSSR